MELGQVSSEELSRSPRRGVLRIGLRRKLPRAAPQFVAAILAPDGRQDLRLALHSSGAAAIRVHFTSFAAGDGRVWIYAPNGTRSSHLLVDGPYSGRGPFSSGDFWSATIHSDTVVVEFDAPGTAPADFPFRIDAISHQWTTADDAFAADGSGPAPCELDVTCYSAWVKYASGVPLYTFMADDGGAYACSGVMLNTSNQIFEPYMLTANHCISSSSEAQSIEAYFNFQTAACGAQPPDLGSLGPVVGGVYLTGAPIPHGDYTLVKLPSLTPGGFYLFGWSATDPAIGEAVTGIHHPEGSWTRVSFGTRAPDQTVSIAGSQAPSNLFDQVDFTQGIVEPGSSGSPLLNSKAEVVGTLSGAPQVALSSSACNINPFPAVYGRFSDAYPALAPYLNVNPAPVFSVAPSPLAFTKSNGVLSPERQAITVTTQSPSLVPFSVQASDLWVLLIGVNGAISSGTVAAGAPVEIGVVLDDSHMTFNGSYKSTVNVTVGSGVPAVVPVTLSIANTTSNVLVILNSNENNSNGNGLAQIVAVPDSSGTAKWTFLMTLVESAGVATKLTGFKVAVQDRSNEIPGLFETPDIVPAESRSALVLLALCDVPSSQALVPIEVDGVDPGNGAAWSQTVYATFENAVPTLAFAYTLPGIVHRNPGTPDCPFLERVLVRAIGNAPLSLNLFQGFDGPALTDQIASIFGSTYVPAGGTVQGDVCWADQEWTLGTRGLDNSGQYYLTLIVPTSPPAPTFSPLSVSPSTLQFDTSTANSSAISVDPGSANLSWNTLVTYPQLPNGWLTVTPARGTGAGSVQVAVYTSALTPGSVYAADLIVQSLNSTPQFLDIPITVTVPFSGVALVNGASFKLGSAPGMAVSLFAPSMKFAGDPQQAKSLPLPAAMQGVTVKVNNIPAPLYYVSPNQVNAQIPYEVPPGPATLTVQNTAGQVATQQIYLNTVAPGIFLSSDEQHLAPDVPVKAGGYATLFFTGQGLVTPAVTTGSAPPGRECPEFR